MTLQLLKRSWGLGTLNQASQYTMNTLNPDRAGLVSVVESFKKGVCKPMGNKPYRIVVISKTEHIASKKFGAWWKQEKFDGPTFFACFVKGFEIGYKLGKKSNGK